MQEKSRRILRVLSLIWKSACCFAVCLLATGCGGGYTPDTGVIVTGKIVKGGKPLEVPNRDIGLGNVEVLVVPLDPTAESAEPFSDLAQEDGSFRILGKGRGVSPGKYRLAVHQQDQGFGSDMLQGAFSETKSPIEIDVPADKVGGTLDLGVIDLDQAGQSGP